MELKRGEIRLVGRAAGRSSCPRMPSCVRGLEVFVQGRLSGKGAKIGAARFRSLLSPLVFPLCARSCVFSVKEPWVPS